MGFSSFSSDAYDALKTDYSTKSTDDIFTSNRNRKPIDEMLPKDIKFREARDSEEHPTSLAIAVFLDETGSMGDIPEYLVKNKLGILIQTLIDHGIEHPSVLFGAIGDHISDSYPLQVGQFESGTEELDKWLTGMYLEGYGGGQDMESYLLAWLFASRHTTIDCFEKRKEKGFLFTIGDEKSWGKLDANYLKELMGYAQADSVSDKQLLAEAQKVYNVYHIHINETGYRDDPNVLGYWRDILGERLIILDDKELVAEIIASTVGIMHGITLEKMTADFDPKVALAVSNAISHLSSSKLDSDKGTIKL